MPLLALVDVNSFYCSCERVFQPRLQGLPVVVLSNNDGCIIARTNEAKALGIKMGTPFFQVKELVRKEGLQVFSSNYALYADMSRRAMSVISQFSPSCEIYSIDECFCDLTGITNDLQQYGQQIRQRVLQWTGLPVCVGIGNTKTLAKIANHLAKKRAEFSGVCDLNSMSTGDRLALLRSVPAEDVWGIGQRLAERLRKLLILTAADLQHAPRPLLRSALGVVVERTARELAGETCLTLEEQPPPRKQIVVSRSFGDRVTELGELRAALTAHVERAGEKLRQQGGAALQLSVFIHTSPFTDDPQYSNSATFKLPRATDDTRTLVAWAELGLQQIFRPGFRYAKAGVMLMELQEIGILQHELFQQPHDHGAGRPSATQVMDSINKRYGTRTACLAASLHRTTSRMKQSRLSPKYTTSWSDIPIIHAV